MAGYTGELTIGLVNEGVGLSFDSGRLSQVEGLARPRERDPRSRGLDRESWLNSGTCDALLPGLIFLQLLFGFRSADELEYAFPDCDIGSPDTRVLLNALFPKTPSHIWAIW